MSERAPFYTDTAEQAVTEALTAAPFGFRVFVERLWDLGFEVRKRGGKR